MVEGSRTARRRSWWPCWTMSASTLAASPVEVRVAVFADVIDVFVEDRGQGIPARSAATCSSGACRRPTARGSGLGLHIARRVMTEQGGLDRRAPRPGGGTSFVLRFRRRVVMTARVLIVEDHALVAIGLQLALSARGWEVETTDGPTAADVDRARPPLRATGRAVRHQPRRRGGQRHRPGRPVARHRRRSGDAHRRDPPRRAGRLSGGGGRRLDRQGRLLGRGRRRAQRCARRHPADRRAPPARR